MANLRGTPQSLGVTPLAEGEYSRPVRVRAPAWVFEALSGRNAAEIGRLLESALRSTGEISSPLSTVLRDTGELVTPQEIVTVPVLPLPTALRDSMVKPITPGLSKTLLSIVDSLKAGAVAEYDYRERKWMVSDKRGAYAVYKRDLDKLVTEGLIREENRRYQAK